MDGTKQAIRHEMRRRRRALSAVDLDTADRAAAEYVGSLPAFQAARGIIAYAATDHEVPTARLIAHPPSSRQRSRAGCFCSRAASTGM
jgi:5-formyltetrahydrofolate cyclo-ligase